MEWIASLAGVIIGFLLAWGKERLDRRSRLGMHWRTLREQVEICGRNAKGYSLDNVMAPLYRLPEQSLQTVLQVVLTEGNVKPEEIHHLLEFLCSVSNFNRGLEMAGHLHIMGNECNRLPQVYNRNVVYAEKLTPDSEIYRSAVQVCNRHLKLRQEHVAP